MLHPKRSAALAALGDFLPHAGRDYAEGRNTDPGPEQQGAVSRLSPWIRTRMLPEWYVISAVLERHSASAASKYIDEVCWRTYWKGWLQLRPSIWKDYLLARNDLLDQYADHPDYNNAISGQTGIDCFDAWAKELTETNQLHNHARMWYASIWVHSLKLPWQLGADWFLRHLLDGDPASNTLSWRWVTGLHTRGKSYLARPDNIRTYTNNRFRVDADLATKPLALQVPTHPSPTTLQALSTPPQGQRLGLLVTDEDLSSPDWLSEQHDIITTAGYFPQQAYHNQRIANPVINFRRASMKNEIQGPILQHIGSLLQWIDQHQLDGILLAQPPVGFWDSILPELENALSANGKRIHTTRHPWDEHFYPQATHGFFRFKQAIPQALEQLNSVCTHHSLSHELA
ncbi:FAD-binding domain-containing protein [Coraliomargarita akajimensis]|uniref:DNA photolyase FAD-binding protein n=1 Tax=Coraliomargarita akajimensis (strain DSM 45221 / IAM 15411 / JCM 23193 / KCTC 12865 / 04OKA010-24) TaxID=583355 RepID=D5EL51_CORAD|nr:FAD-binding domain-containing protein [Coraliomargarita akajimensis]ADE53153.1 DNA photolyase FAD-binding protein [Coraliomargarita akajimensis DSM 45221]